jgi:predicted short-subunit dehydrogenase-like oxidoreductase (DUF2520 family)
MRELERHVTETDISDRAKQILARGVGIVGGGRVGNALATALANSGVLVEGPAPRGHIPDAELILLCVPDRSIVSVADQAAGRARFLGHTSGSQQLSALEPARRAGAEVFSLHPAQTFSGTARDPELLKGSSCAVSGSTQLALEVATQLAHTVGLACFSVPEDKRPTYHTACSVASNFLICLEQAAEALAESAGLDAQSARSILGPLVRTSVDNWQRQGPFNALTGPIARGDQETLQAQRQAVSNDCPEVLALFDALVARTRALAAQREDG